MNPTRKQLVVLSLCLPVLCGCPAKTPVLAVTPEVVAFDATDTPRTIAVRNAGTGETALSFSIAASVDWLSLNPAEGVRAVSDPAVFVTVTLDRARMNASKDGAIIEITSNGGNKALPVTVAPSAVLAVSTGNIDYGRESGERIFEVSNAGPEGSELRYTVENTVPWLEFYNARSGENTASGTLAAGDPPVQMWVKIRRPLSAAKAAYEGVIHVTSNGGNADVLVTAEPVLYLGLAQKGYVAGAAVYNGDVLVATTSATPGRLGRFELTVDQAHRGDILTVAGGSESRDTLDETLDTSDPSFDGRFLELYLDSSDGNIFVNPATTLVAAKYRLAVAKGSPANWNTYFAAREAVLLSGGVRETGPDDQDIMQPGYEILRLRNERLWAVCELGMAAGNTFREAVDALAASLDGTPERGTTLALLDAVVNNTPHGLNLFPLQLQLKELLDHLFPQLPKGAPAGHAAIAAAQGRLRRALDGLREASLVLDGENGRGLIAGLNQDTPTANAGIDQPYAKTGGPIRLDGTKSSDPRDRALSYFWGCATSETPVPDTPLSASPSIPSDRTGVYTYYLWVFNGIEWSAPDSVTVTITANEPPVANAGPDISVPLDRWVVLSAGASHDPNGDPLQSAWVLLSGPAGAVPEWNNIGGPAVAFRARTEGVYELQVTVSDGFGGADSDTVLVTVDFDGDGIPGPADDDRDGDGVLNGADAFPDDPCEWIDSAGDGTGNYARQDEDGDGVLDVDDWNPLNADRSDLPVVAESGVGENPDTAQLIAEQPPFAVTGEISGGACQHFKIASTKEWFLSILEMEAGDAVEIELLDGDGEPISPNSLNVNPECGILHASAYALQVGQAAFVRVCLRPGASEPVHYRLLCVNDFDRDGLDDEIETAFGMNPLSGDSDGDGVPDAAESGYYLRDGNGRSLYGFDLDGDGLPNWLDPDSDGDWIPDRVEGTADRDDDGTPAFADLDADGNGISDRDEAGLDPLWPMDTDLDGAPDFADVDDDGDGLLDVNDPERLVPLVSTDMTSAGRLFVTDVRSEVAAGVMPSSVYGGELLQIAGSGFLWGNTLVLFEGTDRPQNVSPQAMTPGLITVRVPAGAGGRVSVAANGVKSNAVDIRVLRSGQPGLYQPDTPEGFFLQCGETITLHGQHLAGAEVRFDGATVAPSVSGDTWLEVAVPAQARTGGLTVATAAGKSNSLEVEVGRLLEGTVSLPPGCTFGAQSLLLVPDGVREVRTDGAGRFTVNLDSTGPVTLDALIETADGGLLPGLQTLVLPGDTAVMMNAWTTATAMVFNGTAAAEQAGIDALDEVRMLLDTLPEVQTLGGAIAGGLAADPAFLNHPGDSFFAQSVTAYSAAQASMAAAGLVKRRSAKGPFAEGVEKGLTATITPDELFGVELALDEKTGNISLLNDTQFYVSAQIRQPGAGGSRVLQPHIDSYFHKDLVGPQGWGILSISNQHDYDQPRGRDCTVQVTTPGIDGYPSLNNTAVYNLRLRTAVDQFLVPVVTPLAGKKIKGRDLAEILLSVTPGAINEFNKRLEMNDVKGAFRSLFYNVLVDAKVREKFLDALGKKLGYGMGEEFAKRVAEKVSARLVPFVGQAKAAMDILDTANLVGGLGGLMIDLALTPSEFVFNVDFDLAITSVDPPFFISSPTTQTWTVRGKGFSPVPAGWLSSEKRPQVYVYAGMDPEFPWRQDWHELTVRSVNATGTEMTVEAPAAFCGAVASCSGSVKVENNGGSATWERLEQRHSALLSVTPNRGAFGTPLRMRGLGLTPDTVIEFYSYPAGVQDPEPVVLSSAFRRGNTEYGQGRVLYVNDGELLVYPPANIQSSWVRVRPVWPDGYDSLPFHADRWTVRVSASATGDVLAQGKDLATVYLNGSLIKVIYGNEWSDHYQSYYGSFSEFHKLRAGEHALKARSMRSGGLRVLSLSFDSSSGQPYVWDEVFPVQIYGAPQGEWYGGNLTVGDNPAYLHP